MRLAEKVALVTRIDSEYGQAIAVGLAREGAAIAGWPERAGEGQDAKQAVEAAGGKFVLAKGDASSRADAERIVQAAVQAFGRLDILVNLGASRRIVGTVLDISDEDFEEEMAADLKRPIALSRFAIPVMAQTGGGAIVNISTIAGYGVKGRALRSASKGALNALTRSMALDHGAQNIRVNAVIMGAPMTTDLMRAPEQLKRQQDMAPLKRLNTPEDLAAAVVFLASDEARNTTGLLLPVDAGTSLGSF